MARPKKDKEEKYIRQNISMEPEQLKRVIDYCLREDRPISWVVRQALNDYLLRNSA
ncbi:hypothetical protein [Murimonas intestini]|uniref:hypothetical protein n=1 Tax=Murimonas intestini TaxID=1337051 RepID=UPI00248C19C8|nr:hypothetical protein [Murimonas intestini]